MLRAQFPRDETASSAAPATNEPMMLAEVTGPPLARTRPHTIATRPALARARPGRSSRGHGPVACRRAAAG